MVYVVWLQRSIIFKSNESIFCRPRGMQLTHLYEIRHWVCMLVFEYKHFDLEDLYNIKVLENNLKYYGVKELLNLNSIIGIT